MKDGHAVPELSQRGGLAVAVPGEVRGLGEMVRRWGKLPFRRCVEPAERMAEKGFPVSWRLAGSLASLDKRDAGPPADHRFAEDFLGVAAGKLMAPNAVWRRPDLAWTLSKLRAQGADAFYKGEIADEIVKAVRGAGGVLTIDDLHDYAAVDRVPLATDYHGTRVYSMPPSS